MSNARKKLYPILAMLMLAVMVFTGFSPVNTARASTSETTNNFDSTSVNEDLSELDLSQYTYDKNGTPHLITFAEYCFSARALDNENYGLYLYIYNPARLSISEREGANTISIAVDYGKDEKPNRYENIPIKLCGVSTGELSNLIYKYRIIDNDGKILRNVRAQDSASSCRRYDIAGVQLWESGKNNARDYGVGGTYKFTGYAKGYGNTDESTLSVEVQDLETLSLDAHSTYYRPKGENVSGTHIQDQLNSVYFAVPNDMLKRYGAMQAVHVEWYEYLTKEVFVTGNSEVYGKLKNYIGQKVTPYNENTYYGLAVNYKKSSGYALAEMTYNSAFAFYGSNKKIDTLYYLFSSGNKKAKDYSVSSKEFQKYIEDYSKARNSYGIADKYSNDLFCNYVDEGRVLGYNETRIQADDGYSLSSYVLNKQSWWDKLWGIKNYTGSIYDGIEGIREVKAEDFSLGDSSKICDKLYIAESDYNGFKEFYDTSATENKTVFLLRFAVTDYVSKPVTQIRDKTILWLFDSFDIIDDNAYMAQQTVFLDFDIIDVTFYKDGVSTVIPVVSSPIDIINTITPPVNLPQKDTPWWVWLILAFALIVIFVVLSIFVKPLTAIITLAIKIIWFPFKLLGKLFKAIFKKRGSGSG